MGEIIAALAAFFLLAITSLVFSIRSTLLGAPMPDTLKEILKQELPIQYCLFIQTQVQVQSDLLFNFEDCSIIHLNKNKIVLGRDQAVDVLLDDPRVSRQHFQIVQKENGYELKDLNSRNGTYVNGVRLDNPHMLRIGDIICAGRFEAIFETEHVLLEKQKNTNIDLDK